jgi:vacuolar iron transporter family protein
VASVTDFGSAAFRAPADLGPAQSHMKEPHAAGLAARLNWLRAGVLGANDGIVSTAGLVVGVAAATTARSPTAGIAGLAAGAVAMALGEYVSVSSQRDTELAYLPRNAPNSSNSRAVSWLNSPASMRPKA